MFTDFGASAKSLRSDADLQNVKLGTDILRSFVSASISSLVSDKHLIFENT